MYGICYGIYNKPKGAGEGLARELTESYAYLVRVQDGVLCYVDCRSTRLALLESIHSLGQKILDRTHMPFFMIFHLYLSKNTLYIRLKSIY